MPYEQQQQLMDEGFPFGLQNYWKSEFLKRLPDEAIDVDRRRGSPAGAVAADGGGAGAVRRRLSAGWPPSDSAFGHRDWDYNFLIISRWTDPAEADAHIAVGARGLAGGPAVRLGRRVRELPGGGQEGADRIRAAYGANYDRLVALKNQVRPDQLLPASTRTSSRSA